MTTKLDEIRHLAIAMRGAIKRQSTYIPTYEEILCEDVEYLLTLARLLEHARVVVDAGAANGNGLAKALLAKIDAALGEEDKGGV